MYSCIEGYLAKKQIPAHGLKDIEAPDKPQAELAFQSEARKEASKACREANDSWRGECSSYVCTELKAIYKK